MNKLKIFYPNFSLGCLTCWCCPCTMYNIYKRADEDFLGCCWPMTLWSLRTKVRTLFRIRVCFVTKKIFLINFLK
jgi:hypothetical protein